MVDTKQVGADPKETYMIYGCFCKLGVPCCGCPYKTSPTIWGSALGPLIFENSDLNSVGSRLKEQSARLV